MGYTKNVVYLLIVVSVTVFLASNAQAAKGSKKGDSAVTDAVLQADLVSYADRYASIAAQAIDDVEILAPPPDVRRLFMGDLIFSAAAACTIAADADPQVALLDMVVLASLGRMIFEEHWLPEYGVYAEPVVAALEDLELQAWKISDPFMTPDQKAELRERIETFRRANPELTNFSHLRFADFPSKRASSTLTATGSGGIFKSVGRITDQVEQTRMLAERGMYLSTRLPLLGGGFADIWLSRLASNPAVDGVIEDIDTFAEVSERLAIGAEDEGQAGEPVEPVRPFDIEDYRQTLIQASTAIQDLNNLVGSTRQLIDSDGAERLVPQVATAIDNVGGMGEAMIDRIFARAIVFLILALVGFIAARLTYRWFERRLFGAPA